MCVEPFYTNCHPIDNDDGSKRLKHSANSRSINQPALLRGDQFSELMENDIAFFFLHNSGLADRQTDEAKMLELREGKMYAKTKVEEISFRQEPDPRAAQPTIMHI